MSSVGSVPGLVERRTQDWIVKLFFFQLACCIELLRFTFVGIQGSNFSFGVSTNQHETEVDIDMPRF
jgi:hypothetical protein